MRPVAGTSHAGLVASGLWPAARTLGPAVKPSGTGPAPHVQGWQRSPRAAAEPVAGTSGGRGVQGQQQGPWMAGAQGGDAKPRGAAALPASLRPTPMSFYGHTDGCMGFFGGIRFCFPLLAH